MLPRILLSSPDVGPHEEKYLLDAFRSGWIAPLGPQVDELERRVASQTTRKHAVALSSGTAGLHLALLNLGIAPGDRVLTSSMTFAATANAITYTGAQPVFIDSNSTGNMDPELLAYAVDEELRAGRPIKAIVPVDLLGKIADYEAIDSIAKSAEIPVVADAAESFGAIRNGKSSGSFGHTAIVSFNGNKIMTTSGGGMLLTDDAAMAERARYLATQARKPVVHYEHSDIGFNYRLSNLLAGLGLAQLDRLPGMIERRKKLRRLYADYFSSHPGVQIFGGPDGVRTDDPLHRDTVDNCWLTSILVDSRVTGWKAMDLMKFLNQHQIESRPLWKPMHLQPVFEKSPAYINGTSESMFNSGLSLPSGSSLRDDEIARIFETLDQFLRLRSK
jgi:dTDP-4-amino-4,6-dideoxygalactose transaminase